ncbi:MAG TPA: diphosphomevalonate decarboxylase [Candidatus Bathyarchaeia archaeon]|nr:diphosphomevalonate decarboxylase [Candidatus Bathyarchaeia archaeon]
MKATARAYAIQGLIKYHGLRNEKLRIPYHDSISVCMKSLPTTTTVETQPELGRDITRINGQIPSTRESNRILAVINRLREQAGVKTKLRIESRNPRVNGKGLGFSASGFAALGRAASKALDLEIPEKELSEIVRLGAGSAARSLVGGFSIWYANKNGESYGEQLAPPTSIKLKTVIAPVPSQVRTDRVHSDSLTSLFYRSRLSYIAKALSKMRRAIIRRNIETISELAEVDTLNLHAVTMTGRQGIVLVNPISIAIINEVRQLRQEGTPCWFSLDTGPSVFVNTTERYATKVNKRIRTIAETIVSEPGGSAETSRQHLF